MTQKPKKQNTAVNKTIMFPRRKKENRYRKVLLVSHSGVGIALRTYFEGFPQDDNLLKYGIKNCEIIRYNTEEVHLER